MQIGYTSLLRCFFILLFLGKAGVVLSQTPALTVQKGGYPAYRPATEHTYLAARNEPPIVRKADEPSPPATQEYEQSNETGAAKKSVFDNVKVFFASRFSSKKTDSSAEKKEPLPTEENNVDKGLDEVAKTEQEQNDIMSDYIGSAAHSQETVSKNLYQQGLQAENEGNMDGAVRYYTAFIRANQKMVSNGMLAAPYHRLALLAWKHQKDNKKAAIYFRYALKYAKHGNIPIISGDFSLFLMERDDYDNAEIVLRNALSVYPEEQRLWFCLAKCTAGKDHPIEALRYFTRAVGQERAYREMATIYRQRREFEYAQHFEAQRMEYLAAHSLQNEMLNPAALPVRPIPFPRTDNTHRQEKQEQPQVLVKLPPVYPQQVGWQSAVSAPQPVSGWQAIPPVPQPPIVQQAAAEPMPVSRVIHYPSGNSPSPVYYEYQGRDYPYAP
jgi:tetratricopeptide (TPR) repeat protein